MMSENDLQGHKEKYRDSLDPMNIIAKWIVSKGMDHAMVQKAFDLHLNNILLTDEERDFTVFKNAQMKKGGSKQES